MKKNIFASILGVFLLNTLNTAAQGDLPVRRFEFEIKIGCTYPMENNVGIRDYGTGGSLEARWNMVSPFDVGLELYAGHATRHGKQEEDLTHNLKAISVVADYNFQRGQAMSPFVGIGLGCAEGNNNGYVNSAILFTPRVGLEFWHHLRLTLDARVARKGYNTIGLSVSYVFGGGLKSKNNFKSN